jgi:hypothetical protein
MVNKMTSGVDCDTSLGDGGVIGGGGAKGPVQETTKLDTQCVESVQEWLESQGYDCRGVDGMWGEGTKAAWDKCIEERGAEFWLSDPDCPSGVMDSIQHLEDRGITSFGKKPGAEFDPGCAPGEGGVDAVLPEAAVPEHGSPADVAPGMTLIGPENDGLLHKGGHPDSPGLYEGTSLDSPDVCHPKDIDGDGQYDGDQWEQNGLYSEGGIVLPDLAEPEAGQDTILPHLSDDGIDPDIHIERGPYMFDPDAPPPEIHKGPHIIDPNDPGGMPDIQLLSAEAAPATLAADEPKIIDTGEVDITIAGRLEDVAQSLKDRISDMIGGRLFDRGDTAVAGDSGIIHEAVDAGFDIAESAIPTTPEITGPAAAPVANWSMTA